MDVLDDLLFGKTRTGIVVCPVPFYLEVGELFRKILDFGWKSLAQILVFTSFPCVPVFQSTICLIPSQGIPAGRGATGDRIGAARRQAVEQRVTGRAAGPAEIGLPWSALTTRARQIPGRLDEIKRSHRSPPGDEAVACESGSTTRISR